jgi:hypothetical protein
MIDVYQLYVPFGCMVVGVHLRPNIIIDEQLVCGVGWIVDLTPHVVSSTSSPAV